jgi:hypothetical protein
MVKETQAGATAEDTKKESHYRTFTQTNQSKKEEGKVECPFIISLIKKQMR